MADISFLIQGLIQIGTVLGDLAENIERAINSGIRIFDDFTIRRSMKRYTKLSREMSKLEIYQKDILFVIIEMYLEKPSVEGWENVKNVLAPVLGTVSEMLKDLENEESPIVIDPIYIELLQVLEARAGLVRKMYDIPAPLEENELNKLWQVYDEYERLVIQLRRVNEALQRYIKKYKN